MRLLLLLILSCFSLFCYGQFDLQGSILNAGTDQPEEGACVTLFCQDSVVKGAYTDSSGGFRFKNIPKGEYLIKSSSFFWSENILLKVESDTTVLITKVEPLAYDQPCRIIKTDHNIRKDLPNESLHLEKSRLESLVFMDLPDREELTIIRMWKLPDLGYLSGSMYELTPRDESWEIVKYTFKSNYQELQDSLSYENYPESDSLYYSFLHFEISSMEVLSPESFMGILDKHFPERMIAVQDHCELITKSDRYCCLDGINYDLEIKYNQTYKFIRFSNPQHYPGKYEQVDIFLELLDFIDNQSE